LSNLEKLYSYRVSICLQINHAAISMVSICRAYIYIGIVHGIAKPVEQRKVQNTF